MTITIRLPDGKALELPDGATGADAASPGLSSVFIASVSELSANFGWAPVKVRRAAVPWVAGAPAGAVAAATASPAR